LVYFSIAKQIYLDFGIFEILVISVRANVTRAISIRGLSEMSFLIDFWPLNLTLNFGPRNRIRWRFGEKYQDSGDIKVGQKSLFLPQNFKK
jgi:hypothetical protein